MKDFYTVADLENWNEPSIRLGVLGDPIAHSRSPEMLNAALQHCGLEMQYAPFQVAPEELERALRLMAERNFVGVNLTRPHKLAAAELMGELDEFAQAAGAVNCVLFEDGKLIGFNTDGPGFSRAVRHEFFVDLRDLRVLLFGTGGAGRAIAQQCAREGCERLVLVNRTHHEAAELVSALRPYFQGARVLGPVARLEVVEWKEAALRFQIGHSDLLVNATPLGMKRSDPPVVPNALLEPHLIVYDTVYEPARTALVAAATEAGARGANGLSMLLYQGALSFEHWFDREAPLDVMRGALL
ncbi:MAG TPA: shikimate dehydrogenase [Chthoniobacterales bacterium]|nr:shikimate dehydrogenase [Chthoniobacterales bacterium]